MLTLLTWLSENLNLNIAGETQNQVTGSILAQYPLSRPQRHKCMVYHPLSPGMMVGLLGVCVGSGGTSKSTCLEFVLECVWWLRGKEPTSQCGTPRFNPWVGKILWRRKWQPIPVFLPEESHGQRSLAAYSSWGRRVRHNLATKLQCPFQRGIYQSFVVIYQED
ncbi:unnamed protein product [Rangifer tarandus platyrhynchus]|uniref:Uncharacterized protein n=2 Tax=Rangifer tarandus platyrhynchus TaxID=3082113 RepID=A0ABN9A118_RANTA|nr:unnamed protein product [Rangifer tarandus platyrhynchus]